MPELYLVDSSVWIFALRRNPKESIRRRLWALLEADAVGTCGVIELELLGGAVTQREFDSLKDQLAGLHRFAMGEADWITAAGLAFSLRRVEITLPSTDILLATLAIRHDATLLHADRDFDLIAAHSALRAESLVGLVSGS